MIDIDKIFYKFESLIEANMSFQQIATILEIEVTNEMNQNINFPRAFVLVFKEFIKKEIENEKTN